MEEQHNYFSEYDTVDTSYFENNQIATPMNVSNAGELAFGTAFSQAAMNPDEDISSWFSNVPDMEANMHMYGKDTEVSATLEGMRQDLVQGLRETMPDLAAAQPIDSLSGLVQAYGDAESAVQLTPDRALMNTMVGEDYEEIQDEEAPSLFADVLAENTIHSTLVDVLDDAMSDVELVSFGDEGDNLLERYEAYASSTTKLVKDVVELAIVSPVTERQFRTQVLDSIGIAEDKPYVFRSQHLDTVMDWLLEGSPEEQMEKALSFVDVVQETESAFGSNSFYSISFMEQVRDNIRTYGRGSNWAAADDINDFFAVGDAALILRTMGSRLLGRISGRSKGLDVQAYEELENEVRTFADRVAGNNNVQLRAEQLTTIPVRGSKGSLADNLYKRNPYLFRSIMQRTEPQERSRVLQQMGIPEDDVIVRTYGTPDDEVQGINPEAVTAGTPSGPFSTTRQTLFDEQAQENAINREVQNIRSHSHGTLHPQNSKVVQAAEESDTLEFQVIFGADGDKGFSTAEQADNARMFLSGNTGEVIQRNGEYFLQTNLRTQVLARDANPFQTGDITLPAMGPVLDNFIPYANRVNRDLWNSISASTDISTQQATQVRQMLGPIRNLSTRRGEDQQWGYLLDYGDNFGTVLSRDEANRVLGGGLTDEVWDAYQGARRAYDYLHEHRNAVEYRRLLGDDMRSVSAEGTSRALSDDSGELFGQPLNIDRARSRFNEIASGDLEVPVFFNDGQVRQMNARQLEELYEEGGTLLRPNRAAHLDGGDKQFDLIAVRSNESIQPLTPNPLPKRPGHVDRRYAEPGYIIRQRSTVTRNGRPVEVFKPRAVVKDKNEVRQFIQNQSNPDEWDFEQSRELRARLGEELTEAEAERLSSTLYPPHSRGRGTALQGADGTRAALQSPDEVLNSLANEVRGLMGKDIIEVLKSKYVKRYSPQKGLFPNSAKGLHGEQLAMYRFIQNQENALTGKLSASWFDGVRRMTQDLLDSPEDWKRSAGVAMQGVDRNYLAAAAKLNTYLFIIGRIGYQVTANLLQQFYLFAQDPILFAGTLPRSWALTAGMALDRTGVEGKNLMMRMLGRTFGLEGEDFAKLIKQMHDSGSTNVGMADDFLHMMTGATRIQAGASLRQTAMNAPAMPFKGVYAASIKMTNITNYAHAVGKYLQGNPGASIFSAKARTEISATSRRLGFTQNRADQFAYQQSSWIIPLQFMQHVQKMFFNTTLDPLFKVVTRRGINIGQQGANVFAETRAKAATTLLISASAFGLTSYVPEDAKDPIRNSMRDFQNLPDDIQTVVLDGWFNLISEKMLGEHFNWGDRFSGNSFVRSFLDMHSDSNILDFFMGPTGASFAYMRDALEFSRKFRDTPIIDENAYREVTGPMMEMFAGARDLTKARIAKNHGAYVTANGYQTAEINPQSAFLIGLSLTPQKAQEYWSNMDGSPGDPAEAQEIASMARRWFLRELNVLGPDVTSEQIVNLHDKALQALYVVTSQGEGGTPMYYREVRDFYRQGLLAPENREEGQESEFIMQYGNRLMRSAKNYEEAINNLNRAAELYPEYSDMLDRVRSYFEDAQENMEEGL